MVYEDPDLIVVDKPAGLVVHPGPGHRTGTLVARSAGPVSRTSAALAEAGGTDPDRPGIVHRLDRGTSGLMVVARTPDAYRSLVDQLGRREVARNYRVLVARRGGGGPPAWSTPPSAGRSALRPGWPCPARARRPAPATTWTSGSPSPVPTTLLTATLETGRTHQIRVHLTAIGHPVVGRRRLRPRAAPCPDAVVTRPFLHACRLRLDHPATGEPMSWTSELPDDLRLQLDRLGP